MVLQNLELEALLADIKKKMPSAQESLELSNLVNKRIAECTEHETVWCRGVVSGYGLYRPAVVILDRNTRQVNVLSPNPDTKEMEVVPHHFFSSDIPYIGIARSVYNKTIDNGGSHE